MNYKSISLVIALFITCHVKAQTADVASMVKAEAVLKAQSYMNLIPQGSEKDYGFTNRNDFSRAAIGEPYQTYYVSDKNKNNALVLLPGNEWRVPISVDSNNVALLTVIMDSGKAKVVNFGANVLAQKLQEFELAHKGESNDRILIRNTVLKRDYLALNLSAFSNPAGNGKALEFNTASTQFVYKIGAAAPEKITVAGLYAATMEQINKTTEK